MGRKLSLEIIETVEELKKLLRKQREGRLKERVQALYLLKTRQARELKELGQVVGRDTSTLYRWFKRYRKGGLASLLDIAMGDVQRHSRKACRPLLRSGGKCPRGLPAIGLFSSGLRKNTGWK